MKRSLVLLLVFLCALSEAKTRLYGEANAFSQIRSDADGLALELHGYLSEFGFEQSTSLTSSTLASFDATFRFGLLETILLPYEGQIAIDDAFGQVRFFYGDSPVAHSNQLLSVMNNDPISLASAMNYTASQQLGVPTGSGSTRVDGLGYQSPEVAENLYLDTALIPAEVAGGETGMSVAGHYRSSVANGTVGFEANVESENSLLIRFIGDTKIQRLRLGGGFQIASNSQSDASARMMMLYVHSPLVFGRTETKARLLMTLNRLTDRLDNETSQASVSLLDEWPMTDKVSTYGFIESFTTNDLDEVLLFVGGGLRMEF